MYYYYYYYLLYYYIPYDCWVLARVCIIMWLLPETTCVTLSSACATTTAVSIKLTVLCRRRYHHHHHHCRHRRRVVVVGHTLDAAPLSYAFNIFLILYYSVYLNMYLKKKNTVTGRENKNTKRKIKPHLSKYARGIRVQIISMFNIVSIWYNSIDVAAGAVRAAL